MLLRHTPKEIKERSALSINPAKTCQPIGAMYAALGIHGCLPHSHGSQGCCAYHRSALTRHYKEPVSAATSSFTEGASVFGGGANLVSAIENIFTVYEPDVIAVHTTCLSETIGDDLPQMTDKAKKSGKVPEGKHVIYANTPSYVGSHVTGFSNMVKGMAKGFAVNTGRKNGRVNIIPGWVEPSDMEEVRRMATLMGLDIILFPDTSGVLNGALTGEYKMFPDGGTPVADLVASGDAIGTLALGEWCSADAARWLDTQCKVPCTVLDMPFGLKSTDRFIDTLRKVAGVSVPDTIAFERGQLVDLISDMHQYFHGKKVALVGDPDQVIALTEFLASIDMKPVHIVTGTPGNKFEKRIEEITAEAGYKANVKAGGDMFLLHQWIKNEPVDLIIGNTYCKYIARDEDIPFLRFGFPILDRVGHQYFPIVGYKGGLHMLTRILDLLLTRTDRDETEEKFELVY
ncbi:MAG: nitrogenase molybdenum-iron protein subunit beta [Desulfomicrobium sp.]|nr:nitrogenase molybdenum-iron protein subunit beta [Pseudomonadota bacterium]MBV1710653.1 nitrogenase molybdenum-iron protein subunit beta [Desulfomicrobium sp.]MBU4570261.1 nitrogenase molybdenum-iron protein subunit beta [Pseudomonadota bacterium]MBU4593181.1 nitrogenase molybdenum-iron protein subunit beta [Pseudomonadota bacterium]MBV1720335.1 nitrogenase molybdenum-iron protein subunit beta [Desulfomicrobium sp.]